MVKIRTLFRIGIVLAVLLSLAAASGSQSVLAYPIGSCTAPSIANESDTNANNWTVLPGTRKTGWKFNSSSDSLVTAPSFGRLDFAGRPDGTGVQHLWSTNSITRSVWIRTGTFWCHGKRGASQGFHLSQTPRAPAMAASRLGGSASNWTRVVGSESTGWQFNSADTTQLAKPWRGRLDTPQGPYCRRTEGAAPSVRSATLWFLGRCP